MADERAVAGAIGDAVIRYSQVWEDHLILEEGLAVGPDDDVLSICSAGDNALALLLREPRSVTAVDLNPAQTALLHLKIAGIRKLTRDELATLLGVREGERGPLYDRVGEDLPGAARAFWDAHRGELEAGIFAAGRLERYIAVFAEEHLARRAPPDKLERLLRLERLEDQKRAFASVFGAPETADFFRHHFGREMMAKQGRDPAQFKFVGDIDLGEHFWRRFKWAMTELPLRGNFYVESFLTRGYRDIERGPLYLRSGEFARLRDLLPRLSVKDGAIGEVVAAAPKGAFSKANLSDLFEYLSDEATESLLALLADRFRPGGRLAYWNLLVPRARPASLAHRLRPLRDLAERLWKRDRSWFYRDFHVEEVLPA